jgi:glycosyltransferase involved in cell wall biosynthesis
MGEHDGVSTRQLRPDATAPTARRESISNPQARRARTPVSPSDTPLDLPAADVERAPDEGPVRLSGPRVRSAVAVLVSSFPRLDETYILREINELEQQGQPVVLVPLRRDHGRVVHEEAKPWLRRALYVPALSFAILLANLTRFMRQPIRYVTVLLRLIVGTMLDPVVLARTLAIFPKSVYFADRLPRMGVRHVHAHFATYPATMAYVISAFSGLPYSFTVHGPDIFVHRMLLRRKLRDAKFVRTVSLFNKAFLTGLYPAITENKIELVHLGVNPNVYARAASEARRSEKPQILSVASLNETKGFVQLVDACARLLRAGVQLECTIVGDGPKRAEIARWVRQHGISDSVRLTGALPQHEVARLMGRSDVFVLPSVIAYSGEMDGIPVTLMEAMAAGHPVIGSLISGIPELVDDEVSGILVDGTHPERLASSIRRLIDDPELREQMGAAGQEKVRRQFDVHRTTTALIATFDRHDGTQQTVSENLKSVNWELLNACAMAVRHVHERANATVAEVTVTDGIAKQDLIVKQHRLRDDSREPVERARCEYQVLEDLRVRMTASSAEETGLIIYSVPRVLLFDDAQATIVMQPARGNPLDRIIDSKYGQGAARGLITPLRRAGTWLRLMQEQTRSDDDGRHVLTLVVLLALDDLNLAAAGDRLIRREREKIAAGLRTLESRVSERPLAVVGQHGDYRAANVFLGDRRVDVIEFDQFREGLPLEDVAHFLIDLRLLFGNPFMRRPLHRLAAAFLEGYNGPAGVRLDDEVMRLHMLTRALRLIARGSENSHGLAGEWWQRNLLRKLVMSSLP